MLLGPIALEAHAQAAGTVAKLAKDFSVSPKMLTKFSKAGLSGIDLGKGLSLAKEIAQAKSLDLGEIADQVLNLKQDGKDWADIAKGFDVELPQNFDSIDLKSLTGG